MFQPKGFSLIELIIVLSVLAVIMAVAVPVLGGFWFNYQLELTAVLLQEDIRALSQKALVKEYSGYRLALDVSRNEYKIYEAAVVRKKEQFPPGVELVISNFTNGQIFFSASGRPTAGGYVALRSSLTGRFKYVIVTPITGRVRISDLPPA